MPSDHRTTGTPAPALRRLAATLALSVTLLAAPSSASKPHVFDPRLRRQVLDLDVRGTAALVADDWNLRCMRRGITSLQVNGERLVGTIEQEDFTEEVKATFFPKCKAPHWRKFWYMRSTLVPPSPPNTPREEQAEAEERGTAPRRAPINLQQQGPDMLVVRDNVLVLKDDVVIGADDDTLFFDGDTVRWVDAAAPQRARGAGPAEGTDEGRVASGTAAQQGGKPDGTSRNADVRVAANTTVVYAGGLSNDSMNASEAPTSSLRGNSSAASAVAELASVRQKLALRSVVR